MAVGAIVAGSSTGVMEVWLTVGAGTGYTIGTGSAFLDQPIAFDWMLGSPTQNISAGKEIMIQWQPHESTWRVTHAECEASP